MENKAVISAAVRTPVGKFMGGLGDAPAAELGKSAIVSLLETVGLDPSKVDEVIMGNVIQAGSGQNPARQSAVSAGIPYGCPSFTVNMVCGSGLKSVALGADAVRHGEAKFVVAGGMENMSAAPFLAAKARSGYRLGHGVLEDSLLRDGLWDVFCDCHMGVLAESLAEKYGVSREEQDFFACESQARYRRARDEGKFRDEIIAVPSGDDELLADEHPRDTSMNKLAALQPCFRKGGTVTAGNSSGINDGAAAVLLADPEEADNLGLPVMAKVADYVSVGLEPEMMGMGAARAVSELLRRNGIRGGEVDLYEINEAFASQIEAVIRELGLDRDRVNVNGGSIAIGHPVGASGARVLVTLLHELARRNGRLGVASLCVGGGMGIAMLVERKPEP